MFIRDIQESDRELYFKMSFDFYSSDAVLHPIQKSNLEFTLQAALTQSPFMRLLIFENQNQVIGYGLLAFYWSNEAGGMVTLLEEFYILPKHRGHQYGSQFMNWLFDTYQSKSARFRLEVCPDNIGAIKLYKKYGFEILNYMQYIR